jgi:hypothetical protein
MVAPSLGTKADLHHGAGGAGLLLLRQNLGDLHSTATRWGHFSLPFKEALALSLLPQKQAGQLSPGSAAWDSA